MTSFADYELIDRLDGSAHGTSWLARPPARVSSDPSAVVLKIVGRQADDDDFRRVANELRLLHSIESPRVVRLLDAGSHEGQLFLTTPVHPGGSLAEPTDPLDGASTASIVADAAEGVHELHQLGIAHRNIHPGSVHIDDKGRGVIGGLDLAQLVTGASTNVSGPIGSIAFISPQLILGNPGTRRTDVWSFGMTLHAALTGSSAIGEIPDASLLAACRHVLHTEPKVADTVPPSVATVIERCLDMTAEPFTTTHDLAVALREADLGALQ